MAAIKYSRQREAIKHYLGNVIPHNHFLCTSCGRLLDLELDMKSIEEVNRLAGENFDGIITSSSTLFYGECSDCIRKS